MLRRDAVSRAPAAVRCASAVDAPGHRALAPARACAPLALAYLCLLASCATSPGPSEDANWLDQQALRSCLGIRVPPEMLLDPGSRKRSVLLELTVLPSGKIESVSIVSGSGSPSLDEYLQRQLGNLECTPFAAVDASEPYAVDLEIDIEARE